MFDFSRERTENSNTYRMYDVHRSGDEIDWWRKMGTDPIVAARALWLETHPQQNETF